MDHGGDINAKLASYYARLMDDDYIDSAELRSYLAVQDSVVFLIEYNLQGQATWWLDKYTPSWPIWAEVLSATERSDLSISSDDSYTVVSTDTQRGDITNNNLQESSSAGAGHPSAAPAFSASAPSLSAALHRLNECLSAASKEGRHDDPSAASLLSSIAQLNRSLSHRDRALATEEVVASPTTVGNHHDTPTSSSDGSSTVVSTDTQRGDTISHISSEPSSAGAEHTNSAPAPSSEAVVAPNNKLDNHLATPSSSVAAESSAPLQIGCLADPSLPNNPYEPWDNRFASYALYQQIYERSRLISAELLVKKKQAAAATIERLLLPHIKQHQQQRNRSIRAIRQQQTKRLIPGLLALINSTVDHNSTINGPAFQHHPGNPSTKQRYPTPEQRHPFRERNQPLPPLSSRRRRRLRCFQFHHRKRGPRRVPTMANQQPSTTTIHPTHSCKFCPAYFHRVPDLDHHVLICHPVADVASPATPTTSFTDVGEATSSITPIPIMLPTNNTTHRVCDGSTSPSSRPTPSIPSEGGPATTDKYSTIPEAPSASLNPSFLPSTHEADHLISQLTTALNQLPPDVHLCKAMDEAMFQVYDYWTKHRCESYNHTLEHPPD